MCVCVCQRGREHIEEEQTVKLSGAEELKRKQTSCFSWFGLLTFPEEPLESEAALTSVLSFLHVLGTREGQGGGKISRKNN